MYLIYVDDCGKPEKRHRKNRFFGLSAVIINECDWDSTNTSLINLKETLSISEIHTRNIYRREKEFQYLNATPSRSLHILEKVFETIANLNIILVSSVVDKEDYYDSNTDDDVEFKTWTHLLERCDMEIGDAHKRKKNFSEKGLIITDHYTSNDHDEKIKKSLEYLRLYGSDFHIVRHIIEDPLFTISKWRNIVQIADAVAYCTIQFLLDDNFFKTQFDKIEHRFRRSKDGIVKNYGLKIYP